METWKLRADLEYDTEYALLRPPPWHPDLCVLVLRERVTSLQSQNLPSGTVVWWCHHGEEMLDLIASEG